MVTYCLSQTLYFDNLKHFDIENAKWTYFHCDHESKYKTSKIYKTKITHIKISFEKLYV